jgi:hypothetical protein
MPKYLPPADRRGGRIAQQLLAKTWQFPFISSEALHSVYINDKSKAPLTFFLKLTVAPL